MVCEWATRKVCHVSSPRTHQDGWAAIRPVWACTAQSRPCALPFPQLMVRRPGCNPRGWGNCSSCWERGGGSLSRKSCIGGGGAGSSKDSLQICKQSDFAVFACWMCLLKPFLDCARYSLAVWVKMCGLQILLHTKWSFILVKGTARKLFKHHREFHYFILITRSAYFYLHLSFFLFRI